MLAGSSGGGPYRRLQVERSAKRQLGMTAPVCTVSLEDKLDKLTAQVKKLHVGRGNHLKGTCLDIWRRKQGIAGLVG